MRPLIYILAGALAAVVVFTVLRSREPQPVWEPLPGAPAGATVDGATLLANPWALPEFQLVERSGQPLKRADLLGRVWIADFFYTTCPGPCPMMTSRLSELQEKLGALEDVRLVSISSDPEKDTPAILQQYAQRFKAGPRWLFATGDKTAIYRLANEGFKLSLTEVAGAAEPITHSTKLALVDRKGVVRGFYDALSGNTSKLQEDVRRILQEPFKLSRP